MTRALQMRILSVQNQQILIKTTMPGMSQALGTSFQLLEAWIEVLIVLDDNLKSSRQSQWPWHGRTEEVD